jgi:hypothetical protein
VLVFVLQILLQAMCVVNDPVEDGVGDDPPVSESGAPHARRAVATDGRSRREMRREQRLRNAIGSVSARRL